MIYIEHRNYEGLRSLQEFIKKCNKYNSKFDYKFYMLLFPVSDYMKAISNGKNFKISSSMINCNSLIKDSLSICVKHEKSKKKSEKRTKENILAQMDFNDLTKLELEKDLTNKNQKAIENFLDNNKRKHTCSEKINHKLFSIIRFFYGHLSLDLPIYMEYFYYSFMQILLCGNFCFGAMYLSLLIAMPFNIFWYCILGSILLPFTGSNIYVL